MGHAVTEIATYTIQAVQILHNNIIYLKDWQLYYRKQCSWDMSITFLASALTEQGMINMKESIHS